MTPDGPRILIVDDERPIRRFLRASLAAHGFNILEAADGAEALRMVAEQRPDLLILDLGLPDMDGIQLTRRLREWTQMPIIILSVRDEESDKISVLDAGADDYLNKPFGVGELMARIRVALRHAARTEEGPLFQFGDLKIDLALRLVSKGDQEVSLTPTEYDLLRALVQKSGRVLTHRHLLVQVWGPTYGDETHLLRVNISNLRRKIEDDPSRPQYIQTEAGVGYRFKSE